MSAARRKTRPRSAGSFRAHSVCARFAEEIAFSTMAEVAPCNLGGSFAREMWLLLHIGALITAEALPLKRRPFPLEAR